MDAGPAGRENRAVTIVGERFRAGPRRRPVADGVAASCAGARSAAQGRAGPRHARGAGRCRASRHTGTGVEDGASCRLPRTFELPTKPSDPSRSTDVGLVDDQHRRLLLVECVNLFGSVNASILSSDRKRAEAEALAVSIGHGEPYTVHVCWVVRATRRNRRLLAAYPELFASRFPGSSKRWVETLTKAASPPASPGLVWCDAGATRIFEWRARVEP